MSLAMEETTFHVGKPLPSAQSMPEEKGHVSATRALNSAGRVVFLHGGGLTPRTDEMERLTVPVSHAS